MISKQVVRWGDGTYDHNDGHCLYCLRIVCYGRHGMECTSGCENPVYQIEDRYKEVKSNGLNYRD